MFQDDVATAITGFFLGKAYKNELNDLRLMKLLYLAEREAMITLGAPLTDAHFSSLPKGPVLSEVLSLMQGKLSSDIWSEHVEFVPHSGKVSNHLKLLKPIPVEDYLSFEEVRLLHYIWGKYQYKDKWDLVNLTHEFPEWDKSVAEPDAICKSVPIPLVDILVKGFEMPEDKAVSMVSAIEYFEAV